MFFIVNSKKKRQKFGGLTENVYLCTRKSPKGASLVEESLAEIAVIIHMVPVVQLVRASDCGSECRGFESHRAPKVEKSEIPNK